MLSSLSIGLPLASRSFPGVLPFDEQAEAQNRAVPLFGIAGFSAAGNLLSRIGSLSRKRHVGTEHSREVSENAAKMCYEGRWAN